MNTGATTVTTKQHVKCYNYSCYFIVKNVFFYFYFLFFLICIVILFYLAAQHSEACLYLQDIFVYILMEETIYKCWQ